MRGRAVLAFLLAATAAGCGTRSEPLDGAAQYPLTGLDATGARVVLPRAPRTVLSLDPAATATLGALGVTSGVTAATVPTTKQLAAADLVILPDTAALDLPAGVPGFRYGSLDPTHAGRAIARLGLAVGRGAQGITLARDVDAAVAATLAATEGQRPTRVLLELGGLQALPASSPLAALIAQLGGTVVEGGSFAAVRRSAPEVWFVVGPTDDPRSTGRRVLQTLRRLPSLARVPAVRDGRVFALDPAALRPSPELPAALDRIARAVRGTSS